MKEITFFSFQIFLYHSSGSTTAENLLGCYRQKYPGSLIYSASENIKVYWGHWSIVQAELNCLKDLYNDDQRWKYAVDLAGSELMVLSNAELGKWVPRAEIIIIFF